MVSDVETGGDGMGSPQPLARRTAAGATDWAFGRLTMLFGLLAPLLIVWIGVGLYGQSSVTRSLFGLSMLSGSTWDVPHNVYGALPFIYGTLVSSALALVVAVPVGIGAALFLSEIAPRWISTPVSFVIELLAAVPSVIFGLWGFLVLCPFMQTYLNPWLVERFGSLPVFAGPPIMTNVLAAAAILSVMVLPLITSVSREVIRAVPQSQREASLGLGATKWETTARVVLRAARPGIVGAVMLALGRAVGETMAVVMVIGNTVQASPSLLQPGYTMPALLANEFNEAFTDPIHRSALIEIAFILFVITLLVNACARFVISMSTRQGGASSGVGSGPMARVRPALAAAWPWAARGAVAAVVLWQAAADVRRSGLAGLLGPIELAAGAWVLAQVITHVARRTRKGWNRWRKANSAVMHTLVSACAVLACLVLAMLLVYVATQGAQALNLRFFTELPKAPTDDPPGGMLNGVMGTLLLVAIAGCIGIPIGLIGGIFLSEFGNGRLGAVARFSADALNGVPSVVIGMFAYTAFVLPVGHFSAMAGGAALGIMMIPTIMRTTEEVLRLVPQALREASLGLGATRTRTIVSVVLPAARAGIMTGIMLSVARVAGETAPLLFTAFGNDQLAVRPDQPVSSITMMIYRYAGSAYPNWIAQAWAGALVLLLLVLVISLAARLATRSRYALR